MRPHEAFVCAECDEVFKAVGTNIRCPQCMSSAFVPASILLRGDKNGPKEMAHEVSRDGETCIHMVERST